MNIILFLMVLIPALSLGIGFLFANNQEGKIYAVKMAALVLNGILILALLGQYFTNGMKAIFVEGPVLYHTEHSVFSIDFFVDGYSFVYLIVATILIGLIGVFSKTYMHREKGYKRFFNNLMAFYWGLIIVLCAGNFETIFIGWEVLGVTSFFLIGFYRERYLPVKNALKVVSLYRLADIALLLGIWICHHFFEHSIHFNEMDNLSYAGDHVNSLAFYQFFIPFTFILAAMVKSAQFPFSSWLPRAMEGPTTSSAIFYGSLSVHIGVFLLIRTAPLWEGNMLMHFIIGGVGLITCLLASGISSVQSSIKTQIAYSSIAQIGIMFIEVALGLYWLAMIHFVGHAFLRSYQLLVSPSVLSYKIHDQFFNFIRPKEQKYATLYDKVKLTVYVWSIKEFNLDDFMYNWLWQPMKKIGNGLSFLNAKITFGIFGSLFLVGLYLVYNQQLLSESTITMLAHVFGIFGLILILKSFVERKSVFVSWMLIILNQLYITLSIGLNEQFDYSQIHLYLSGVFVCGIIGLWVIRRLGGMKKDLALNKFQGHVYEHPRLALIFAVACLGLAGFPITPTFLGEDLMIGHIHEDQFGLLFLTVLNLILDGLVVFRIYSRLFLGPQDVGYHETSYRSA